ncbi:MAG: TonB-dependent receptor [Parvularculaceae bacterium]|nr:TonB-dependent receptor [Parvularculaceae bacterium]
MAKPSARKRLLLGNCAAFAGLMLSAAQAQESPVDNGDFTSFSLEDLMAVEVTTASKRAERASDAAAAVFVLTRDDISRSGAVTIADALRLVPGVNVAQINANSWAVTVRGFNSRFSNKLLVMIDGRSVYTPLFSGTLWDQQNVVLEDIERIEVVRGPGGALWGANAVNGVINIITRSSRDTQGVLAKVAGGDEYEAQALLRVGGKVGENGAYRVYGKFESFNSNETAANVDANDDWRNFRGGFRTDFDLSARDTLTMTGEVSYIDAGETLDVPLLTAPFLERRDAEIERIGAHILSQWTRDLGDGSEISVQGFIDYSDIRIPQGEERRLTVDVTAQHAFSAGESHNLLWGVGFRNISDDIENSEFVAFADTSRSVQIFSGFVQDTFNATDALDIVLGAKFEHNDYTGFEIQPSARFVWRAEENLTFWGAVSRAVRTPSRAEDDIRATAGVIPPGFPGNPGPLPLALTFTGDRSIDSETLISYELGARFRLADTVSFDVTGFFNKYGDLRGSRVGAPVVTSTPPTPRVVLPLVVDELVDADTHGVEAVLDWQVASNWRLQATYAYLSVDGDVPVFPDVRASAPGGADPTHTANLRSLFDISKNLKLDTAVRFVDDLEGFGIDSYVALDARVAWRVNDKVELAVTGRNLTEGEHFEFGTDPSFSTVPTSVERSVFASLTAKF